MQNLNKKIHFDNLVYYFRVNLAKKIIGSKDLSRFYKRRKKIIGAKCAIKNNKTLYESLEKVIKSFNNYSKNVSEAKHKNKIWRRAQNITS